MAYFEVISINFKHFHMSEMKSLLQSLPLLIKGNLNIPISCSLGDSCPWRLERSWSDLGYSKLNAQDFTNASVHSVCY